MIPPFGSGVTIALGSDISAQCALHPESASTGTCPRCGSFVCEQCGGDHLVPECRTCRANPVVRAEKIRLTAQSIARAGFAMVGLIGLALVLDIGRVGFRPGVAGEMAIAAAPLLVLSILQWLIRAPWPGICADLWMVAVLAMYFRGNATVLLLIWALGIFVHGVLVWRLIGLRRGTLS